MTVDEPTGPMVGVRVLDASNLIAGPVAGAILADFGADVVKIEHPRLGDPLRTHGVSVRGVPLWWTAMGRNKRAITLNLSTERGQELFRELARDVDVVIESYRPGTFERWGLGYDRLCQDNPDLVLARVTGFGQHGPSSSRPGFGTLGEAMSGFAYRNGQPDGPPTLPPLGLADVTSGFATAIAICMALFARDRGRGGQEIDVAIIEPLLTVLSPQEIVFDQAGEVLGRTGSRSPMNAPRNVYRAADDQWVAISASTTATAERLFGAMGRRDISGEAWFGSAQSRVEHVDVVDEAVATWVAERTSAEVVAICEDVGAAAGPLYSAADIVEDPQYRALDSLTKVAHAVLGEVRIPNVLFRLSRTPGSIRWAGPEMGEHNEDVFGRLGLGADELADLRHQGVV